ncbi:unnamed protein product [Chrysoparadoxa australica]
MFEMEQPTPASLQLKRPTTSASCTAKERERAASTMVAVRSQLRLPVTSLWTEGGSRGSSAPRAATASPSTPRSKSGSHTRKRGSSRPTSAPADSLAAYDFPETTTTVAAKRGQRPSAKPSRSSHCVGPVGVLGSQSGPGCESRWRPAVSAVFKRQQTPEMKALKHKKDPTVVVIEPPLNYHMVFDGPQRVESDGKQPTTSLSRFRHSPGATLCNGLYEHFVTADQQCFHFYHSSRIRCEVLDPGPYPHPGVPTELHHVLRHELPDNPAPPYPLGSPKSKPSIYIPGASQPPPITEHYVPLCRAACRQSHPSDSCPGASCHLFGTMPYDFMVLHIGQEAPPVQHKGGTGEMNEGEKTWDINSSIFAPRRRDGEARSYFDTDRVIMRAVETDWGRMLKEERVKKFMTKSAPEVQSGEIGLDAALDSVKAVFQEFYRTLLGIFDYYCVASNLLGRGAFSIQQNSYSRLCQDAGIPDKDCTVEELGKIFVLVNFETDKNSTESEVNEDRALMRFELMEALLRIAVRKYNDAAPTCADMLRRLMEGNVLQCPAEALEPPDTFRKNRLYKEDVDAVLGSHQKPLQLIYKKYSMLNPVGGKAALGLDEWKVLLTDCRLLGGEGQSAALRAQMREARNAFYRARMIVSDEIRKRDKLFNLSFVDFLEALARLADMMSVPTDQDLEALKITDIMEFETSLANLVDAESSRQIRKKRESAAVLHDSARPLSEKLDRMLFYMIGVLGVKSKGTLKHGVKSIQLLGTYCNMQQVILVELLPRISTRGPLSWFSLGQRLPHLPLPLQVERSFA